MTKHITHNKESLKWWMIKSMKPLKDETCLIWISVYSDTDSGTPVMSESSAGYYCVPFICSISTISLCLWIHNGLHWRSIARGSFLLNRNWSIQAPVHWPKMSQKKSPVLVPFSTVKGKRITLKSVLTDCISQHVQTQNINWLIFRASWFMWVKIGHRSVVHLLTVGPEPCTVSPLHS